MYATSSGQQVGTLDLPQGWSPVTATAAELKTFGFPSRPTDPGELAAWKATYAKVRSESGESPPCLSPVRHGYAGTVSAPNYGGGFDYDSYSYSQMTGTLKLPQNVYSCPHSSAASFWVGTSNQDFVGGNVIDQTGVDLNPSGVGFQFWVEAYPLGTAYFNNGNNMAGWATGQQVSLSEWMSGSRIYGRAINPSTGYTYTEWQDGAQYAGSSAEVVTEQLAGYLVRNFGTASWTNVKAITTSGASVYFQNLQYYLYGDTWSTTNVSSTAGALTMNWKNCSS